MRIVDDSGSDHGATRQHLVAPFAFYCLRFIERNTVKRYLAKLVASVLVACCVPGTNFGFTQPATAAPAVVTPPINDIPPGSLLCIDGQCRPAIAEITYDGRLAYKLTDGRSEAIVVPAIGRVMHFGTIGGPNWLWKAPSRPYKSGEWRNYGGAKTWPAPQSYWATWGVAWPPPPAWDAAPHEDEVLTGGHLRTISAVAPGLGARLIREFYFNASGEFVIEQTVEKLHGEPRKISLWSVAQIVTPEAVFLPLHGASAYRDGFHWLLKTKTNPQPVWQTLSPNVLQMETGRQGAYKIGVDAPVASIAAVRDGVAFVQRAARPDGQYPDGADKAGFPVEFYSYADERNSYGELELLSPLRTVRSGEKWTHSVRWSLHSLPSHDLKAPNVREAIEKLLFPASL